MLKRKPRFSSQLREGNINTGESLNLLVPESLLKSRALFIFHKVLMKGSKEVSDFGVTSATYKMIFEESKKSTGHL